MHAAPSLLHFVASGQLSWRALARLAWCMAHFQVYDTQLLDAVQQEPSPEQA